MNAIDEYIEHFPPKIREQLEQLRKMIKETAPLSEEVISYGMPSYKLKGKILVYFAGYKNHIGFYATPTGHSEFAEELSKYKQGKGSVQFPINEPMQLDLIKRIVLFRMEGAAGSK
jgi:uncharacterized protein YdhG (YjbR/CyaY superfamily)